MRQQGIHFQHNVSKTRDGYNLQGFFSNLTMISSLWIRFTGVFTCLLTVRIWGAGRVNNLNNGGGIPHNPDVSRHRYGGDVFHLLPQEVMNAPIYVGCIRMVWCSVFGDVKRRMVGGGRGWDGVYFSTDRMIPIHVHMGCRIISRWSRCISVRYKMVMRLDMNVRLTIVLNNVGLLTRVGVGAFTIIENCFQ
jgi:hypothetical protein